MMKSLKETCNKRLEAILNSFAIETAVGLGALYVNQANLYSLIERSGGYEQKISGNIPEGYAALIFTETGVGVLALVGAAYATHKLKTAIRGH